MLEKLNISAIYNETTQVDSVDLPMIFIYNFLIKSPGEPQEHHLDEVRPKQFELLTFS